MVRDWLEVVPAVCLHCAAIQEKLPADVAVEIAAGLAQLQPLGVDAGLDLQQGNKEKGFRDR